VIGKKFVCAFCRSVFESSFEEAEPAPAEPKTNALTRWLPTISGTTSAAARASEAVRKDARVQSARAAILSTSNAVVEMAAPIAKIAAGAASVALPGAGEILNGKTRWGFCTMAAFFGATAAASAAGGAWIALPIAIRVLSAHSAVSTTNKMLDDSSQSLEANAAEARAVAAELARQAQRMEDAAFEKEMQQRETEELQAAEAAMTRRLILVPVEIPKHAV